MVVRILMLGIPPATAASEEPATPAVAPAPEPTAPEVRPAVPWPVLVDRRLQITTDDGATTEGVFLGLDGGAAILTVDDGALVSIAVTEVAGVRVIPEPPPATIRAPLGADTTLAFREAELQARRHRTERSAAITRGTAIAGGVVASLSAVASIVAEGFNVHRWSLSKRVCGQDYYGDGEVCGWTDGSDTHGSGAYSYAYYDNMLGVASASAVAIPLHFVAGPLMLVPSTLLRQRIGDTVGRRRHIAAWALWGAGLGSLAANQAVSWTQVVDAREACEPAPGSSSREGEDCVWVAPTRGAPPGLYLLSAGLTVSSTILAILDANDVARRAEQTAAESTAARRPSVSLFPFRLQRGGGLGVAGRF